MAGRTFRDFQREQAEKADRELIDTLKDVARSLYRQVYEDDQIIDSNLEYYITGEGHEIDTRSPPQNRTSEEQQRLSEVEQMVGRLYEFYRQRKNLKESRILFVNAPYEVEKRTLLEDARANSKQNENMYRVMFPDQETRQNNLAYEIVVDSQENMMRGIENTFDQAALNVQELMIVFNGEGALKKDNNTPSLCFHDEHQPNPSMSLADFKKQLMSLWTKAIEKQAQFFLASHSTADHQPMETDSSVPSNSTLVSDQDQGASTGVPIEQQKSSLDYSGIMDEIPPIPSRVSVIFGQCFSCFCQEKLLHKSDWDSEMELIPLTDAEVKDGKAWCFYKFDSPIKQAGFTRMLKDSHHQQLETYARRYAQEHATDMTVSFRALEL